MSRRAPLAVSVGDPAGIGPEVSVRACAELLGRDRYLLFGAAERLRRSLLAIQPTLDVPVLRPGDPLPTTASIGVVDVARWDDAVIECHAPSQAGGLAQLQALDAAIDAVLGGQARALVTGPISKAAIGLTGVPFVGHTEHLAARAGLLSDAVTMLFLGPRLRTALVTTHLPLRSAPGAITAPRVARATLHLADACLRLGMPRPPRIAVAGLNPHAGEGGMFGDEEQRVVVPILPELRASSPFREGRAVLVGLVPAETAFRQAASGEVDAVVAMTHDQATIASKLLDFGHAVNTTWGLPFVRTSVDHGVAYDAARQGGADPSGMRAALEVGASLAS
jgi:4-hydroxythreonine-4-phosphate dehydrogenase